MGECMQSNMTVEHIRTLNIRHVNPNVLTAEQLWFMAGETAAGETLEGFYAVFVPSGLIVDIHEFVDILHGIIVLLPVFPFSSYRPRYRGARYSF
jgi:hypothetical protein